MHVYRYVAAISESAWHHFHDEEESPLVALIRYYFCDLFKDCRPGIRSMHPKTDVGIGLARRSSYDGIDAVPTPHIHLQNIPLMRPQLEGARVSAVNGR